MQTWYNKTKRGQRILLLVITLFLAYEGIDQMLGSSWTLLGVIPLLVQIFLQLGTRRTAKA